MKELENATIRTIYPNIKDINKHCGQMIESEDYQRKWSNWRQQNENDRMIKETLFRILIRTKGFKAVYSTKRH